MLIGYARVSKLDGQTTDLQERALRDAGCERIYRDTASGKSTVHRSGLAELLATLRKGDELIVWKIDRLARSAMDFLALTDRLAKAGVGFRSLTEPFDTTTPVGRFVQQSLSLVAELERGLIQERTRAGLDAAKARGTKLGRPRALSTSQQEHIRSEVAASRLTPAEAARLFKVSRSTVQRIIYSPRRAAQLVVPVDAASGTEPVKRRSRQALELSR